MASIDGAIAGAVAACKKDRFIGMTQLPRPAGVEIDDIAANFGINRQSISAVLKGRSTLTAAMALRFEKAFGIKAATLLLMQARYDLARAHEIVDPPPIRAYA